MKLVCKFITIADNTLEVEMPAENWEYIEYLKNDPRLSEFSNVENLVLEAYSICFREGRIDEIGTVLSSWLCDIYQGKSEVLRSFLRPFPRSEKIVYLP